MVPLLCSKMCILGTLSTASLGLPGPTSQFKPMQQTVPKHLHPVRKSMRGKTIKTWSLLLRSSQTSSMSWTSMSVTTLQEQISYVMKRRNKCMLWSLKNNTIRSYRRDQERFLVEVEMVSLFQSLHPPTGDNICTYIIRIE